jgi:acetyl esterase/lipase
LLPAAARITPPPPNSDAATTALEIAYEDLEDAFDYYMANYNKDSNHEPRPFILAGHSQGSNLLLMLLERKFSDAALREQLVAAYVIGWSVTDDDMSSYPALAQLGICSSKAQTGCIVTYNTQQKVVVRSKKIDNSA